jgi:hypothetical protein
MKQILQLVSAWGLGVVVASGGERTVIVEDSSCTTVTDLLGDDRLILTQVVHYQEEDGYGYVDVELSYADQSWLGFGYNRDGKMVGSTVVIGFPEKPLIPGKNPGRYYLGNKNIKFIRPLLSDDKNTSVGTTNSPSYWHWQRQLYHSSTLFEARLLEISDATVTQNDTHTVLRFSRPFVMNDEDNNATTVHPNGLNTFVYAVGKGNEFGYHSTQRGSRTIQFSSHCPQGTMSISITTETEAEAVSEENVTLHDSDGGQSEEENQKVEQDSDIPESLASLPTASLTAPRNSLAIRTKAMSTPLCLIFHFFMMTLVQC